jgi:hypothetical protein
VADAIYVRTVTGMNEPIGRKAALDVLRELAIENFSLLDGFGMYIKALEDVDERIRRIPALPPAETKGYTKAEYIMALHKEYGVDFARAEEAHSRALEYLRSTAMMKG